MDVAVPALPLHCTFEAADWQRLAQHWHAVALSSEVSEAPFKATLLDEPLVLYRLGAGWWPRAMSARTAACR